MRQKIAKALAREAHQFAAQTGRTHDVVQTINHGERYTMVPMEELDSKGRIQYRRMSLGDSLTFVHTDGPRFFKQQLKRAYKRGLLAW